MSDRGGTDGQAAHGGQGGKPGARTLRLVTLTRLFVALVFGSLVGGAALSLWSVQRAEYDLAIITQSRESHEAYLRLSADTYRLFKLYGSALLVGEGGELEAIPQLVGSIRAQLDELRALLERDPRTPEGVRGPELDDLESLERTIASLVARLEEELGRGVGAPAPSDRWSTLASVLDDGIDGAFREQIEAALDHERLELEAVERRAAYRANVTSGVALAVLVCAVPVALLATAIIGRRMRDPLLGLRAGIQRFLDGDLATPVEVRADDELGAIARVLNDMAASIGAQTRRLALHGERLENQVRERTAQLEASLVEVRRADDNRRRTLADVGHELRTPLTVIRGEADIALRGHATEPAVYRAALERTREAAAHTATLVDDLLFVARNESGEARLVLADIDLERLVRDTLDTFAADVGREGVLAETRAVTPRGTRPGTRPGTRHGTRAEQRAEQRMGRVLDDGVAGATVRADAHRVRQALLVLIDNARRHGAALGSDGAKADGPGIRVGIERSDATWRIVVEDDGPGMEASDKLVAFKRFFRGSNAAERYGDGLGLGLPVAMSIAEAHGGTIELADAPSGGLRATLVLPAGDGALARSPVRRSIDEAGPPTPPAIDRRGAAA